MGLQDERIVMLQATWEDGLGQISLSRSCSRGVILKSDNTICF